MLKLFVVFYTIQNIVYKYIKINIKSHSDVFSNKQLMLSIHGAFSNLLGR
jgi:hypothetical protein